MFTIDRLSKLLVILGLLEGERLLEQAANRNLRALVRVRFLSLHSILGLRLSDKLGERESWTSTCLFSAR